MPPQTGCVCKDGRHSCQQLVQIHGESRGRASESWTQSSPLLTLKAAWEEDELGLSWLPVCTAPLGSQVSRVTSY